MERLRWIFVNNERRLRAGWRVVIFIGAYVFGGKGLDALFTKLNLPVGFTWQGILGYEISDLLLVCAIAWILSRVEHERFSAYGLPLGPEAGKLLAKGLLWGFIPSALILIPIYLLGGCSFHGLAVHGSEFVKYAFLWALAMLGIGFGEEFLFRGYLLKTLGEGIGFWPAAIALSSLFGLVHFIFKPQEDWIDPTSIALYGIFWCLTLRRTGSLWFAVGFHAASDYADMIAFAEPNTGNGGKPIAGHLLDIRFHGPDWLTGGPRGTEASLLVFIVLAGLFYFFNRAYPAKPNERKAAV
ncbi:MAG: CPBP family intramembrane glutamic endopeptidase [Terriglobales bacterium]|jgi:membrane protease YdiL (CAAX protease family)